MRNGASQAECRRFDPDRPLQKSLDLVGFGAASAEVAEARTQNERRPVAGRGAESATRLPRDVLDSPLRVLVACEYSGRVREAFRARGHDAYSCDLLPADDDSPFHLKCEGPEDIWGHIAKGWDLMIAHPPCTYLTVAGLFRNQGNPERAAKTEEALVFVQRLMEAPIDRIAIENPISCISSRIRKPDQIIQPYQFGEDASKATCLWLKGLPKLAIDPAARKAGRMVEHNGKMVERWANQTDSGQNRLPPSADRWKIRSLTYQAIADAFASAWSRSLPLVRLAGEVGNG